MKKVSGFTKRMVALLLSGMLAVGTIPGTALAAEVQENTVQEEEAITTYTVTLDANGGYFVNEWDDVIGEYIESTEILNKQIPVGETVTTVPVFETDDQQTQVMSFCGWSLERDGEMLLQDQEGYTPVGDCVLYAVWEPVKILDNGEETDIQESDQTEGVVTDDSLVEHEDTEDYSDNADNTQDTENLVDETRDDFPEDQEDTEDKSEDAKNIDDSKAFSEDSADPEETDPERGNGEEQSVDINEEGKEESVRTDAAMSVVASGTCGDNLTWILDNAGTLSISGSGEMSEYNYQGGPWEKNLVKTIVIDNGVASIGMCAFVSCKYLTEVTLPQGLTSIGDFAFEYCSKLTSIEFPESVKTIGFEAFRECSKLNNIIIPTGVTSIGGSAFTDCKSLTDITVPGNVTTIEMWEFSNCTNLMNVTIKDGVSTIQKGAFYGCSNLSSIIIPASVNDIWEEAFTGCPSTLIIYGVKGSYAEQYAKDNGITFNAVDLPGETQQYNIHFDLAGGTLPVNIDYQVTNGEKYDYNLSYVPERQGYNFLGWFTASEGGNLITVDTVVNLTEDQTLYAHWEEATYVVTFDPNGGTVTPTTKIYKGYTTYGELPTPSRPGFEFLGWYRGDNGPKKSSEIIELDDQILYAKWKCNVVFNFDANGGTVSPTSMRFEGDHYDNLPVATRDGYKFEGWYTDKDGGDVVLNGTQIELTKGIHSLYVLYAHWSELQGFRAEKDGWPISNTDTVFSSNPEDSEVPFFKYYELNNGLQPYMTAASVAQFFANMLPDQGKGNCFGLSLLAVAQYEGKVDISKYTRAVPNQKCGLSGFGYDKIETDSSGKSRYSISGNEDLKDLIQRAHISQFSAEVMDTEIFKKDKQYSDLLDHINSSDIPLVIRFENINHAVVMETRRMPIDYGNGVWGIHIYDPNYPQNTPSFNNYADYYKKPEAILAIDTSDGKWQYYDGVDTYQWENRNNIHFYDISGLDNSFFKNGSASAFHYATNKATNAKNSIINIIQSTEEYIINYKRDLYDNSSKVLPCQLFDEEVIDLDYIYTIPYTANSANGLGLNMVSLEDDDYAFHFNGQCKLMSISTNHYSYVEVSGKAAVLIDNEGILQIDNENGREISFKSIIVNANGLIAEVEGILNSEKRIAVAYGDDNSEINPIIVKTDEELVNVRTSLSLNNDIINENFHEKGDSVENVIDSGTCGDNLTWALDDQGTLTISGTGNMKDYEVSFGGPWKSHREEIKRIIIKYGVTSIGSHAFIHCSELSKLTIPGSVNTIGWRAFNNCKKLERLSIANGVTTIDREAFCFCESLKKLVIPDSVTSIGNYAFHGCKSLTSLTISKNVTSIGEYAFAFCESLIELLIPENVTVIGDNAFYNCKSLTDLTISTGVQSIGGSAFSNCVNLTSVTIPGSVKTIGQNAFNRGVSDDYEKRLIIYGDENSYAETFASNSGCIFIYLNAKPIDNAVITVPDQTYTGTVRVPALDVKVDGISLIKEKDYLVKYSNNYQIGEATVKIMGIKNYKGSAATTFRINKGIQQIYVSSSANTISMWETATVTITGAKWTTSFKSSDTSIATVDKQGVVTPVFPGKVTIIATANGNSNYEEALKSVTIEVKGVSIANGTVENLFDKTWTGKAQTQNPKVKINGNLLNPGSDYTVSYKNNKDVGTATMTIKGKGFFAGSITRTFKINKANQSITAKASASSIAVGKTATVSINGAKGTKSFKSSDPSVATVNASTGVVTGKKAGTVTITASAAATANYNAVSKTVKITVTASKSLKKPGNCHFAKWNNSKYTSCRIAWNKVDGADGYETLLSWTNGSNASRTIVKSNVLYRDCTVHPQHVSQMMVRAFYMSGGKRVFGPWSNVEYITPSPTKLTTKNASSGSNLKMNISWNIIYGCNGYNVFLTTNPNGTWYWNQSTTTKADATSAVITKYRGSKLKKNTRYYVRIVTRRKRNGVFCTVPMPASNTYIGSFIIK